MPWARASALHRHLECPAASWLPRFDDGSGLIHDGYLTSEVPKVITPTFLEPRDKRAANAGTEAHAEKERGELHPELWTGVDPDGEHEVSFSYNCDTGEVMEFYSPDQALREEWKAAHPDPCVTGTCDWWGNIHGHNWIDDLKTGFPVPSVLTPAMLFYAMCANDLSAPKRDVHLSMTHWPRRRGTPYRDGLWATVSPVALEGFRMELHEAWLRTTKSNRPWPGAHCAYCPSAAWCPEARG